MLVAVAVAAAVVAVLVVVGLRRSGRGSDPVDSFRRQIDALSPEARRPTISQAPTPEEVDGGEGGEHDPGDGERDGA